MRRRITRLFKHAPFLIAGAIVLAAVLVVVFYVSEREKVILVPEKAPGEETKPPAREAAPERPKVEKRIAIVIDDIGNDPAIVRAILRLNASITFSVLPSCSYSLEASREAHRAGREILLHLPMEPYGYPEKRPGRGTLFLSMNHAQIERQLEEDLLSVPYARGVNNHMGSRFMEDDEKVATVLSLLKRKNLFFLDSMTTKDTRGREVAARIGLKCGERNIFIDNGGSFDETLAILRKVIESRDTWDNLILIGHPHESTIAALREALPLFREKGITIVPLSRIIG